MKTTSIINVMPSNKAEVHKFVKQTKETILSGEENPLKIAVQLRALEDVIKALRSDPEIKDYALEEAEKEPTKQFDAYGAEIIIRETGVKYDYSICNDSILEEKYQELKKLKEQIKDREKFLKSIDGEIINKYGEPLQAPLKKSTTSVTIKLK